MCADQFPESLEKSALIVNVKVKNVFLILHTKRNEVNTHFCIFDPQKVYLFLITQGLI